MAYTDYQLFDVAHRHYEKGQKQEAIASDLGISAATVNRMLKEAVQRRIARMVVMPPEHEDYLFLQNVQNRLREAFQLKHVTLVPGREEIPHDQELDRIRRESIVAALCRAAAMYLDEHITHQDVLVIPWGRVMRGIVNSLNPSKSLENLKVVPMLGLGSIRQTEFEPNALAAEITAAYGANYAYSLPAPAIVRDLKQKEVLMDLPLVREALDLLHAATVAILPIGPIFEAGDISLVRRGLLDEEDVEDLLTKGAIGETCSFFFDQRGRDVESTAFYHIGFTLSDLKRMVQEDRKVIAVVGADPNRIKPTMAALKGKIFNILITDHITATYLLNLQGKR